MLIAQHGRLLIKQIEKEQYSQMGHVFVPGKELEEEDLLRGTVASKNEFYPIGTQVFYSKFSAVTIKNDEDTQGKYHLVHSGDILAINDTTKTVSAIAGE